MATLTSQWLGSSVVSNTHMNLSRAMLGLDESSDSPSSAFHLIENGCSYMALKSAPCLPNEALASGDYISPRLLFQIIPEAWKFTTRFPWIFPAFIALLPLATFTITMIQFHCTLFVNKKREHAARIVPVIPYWIPYLGHAIPMTINPASFVSDLMYVILARPIYSHS